ncbi:hypothetical protein KM043_004017 [Ampulex compressa]|nr:hypothetical protein KM043_004017 [Ampulex compressa]
MSGGQELEDLKGGRPPVKIAPCVIYARNNLLRGNLRPSEINDQNGQSSSLTLTSNSVADTKHPRVPANEANGQSSYLLGGRTLSSGRRWEFCVEARRSSDKLQFQENRRHPVAIDAGNKTNDGKDSSLVGHVEILALP